MLPVLGSRVMFSALATLLLVLLNSTPMSATPVGMATAGPLSSGDLETVQHQVLGKRQVALPTWKTKIRDLYHGRDPKGRMVFFASCLGSGFCQKNCFPDWNRDEAAWKCTFTDPQCRAVAVDDKGLCPDSHATMQEFYGYRPHTYIGPRAP